MTIPDRTSTTHSRIPTPVLVAMSRIRRVAGRPTDRYPVVCVDAAGRPAPAPMEWHRLRAARNEPCSTSDTYPWRAHHTRLMDQAFLAPPPCLVAPLAIRAKERSDTAPDPRSYGYSAIRRTLEYTREWRPCPRALLTAARERVIGPISLAPCCRGLARVPSASRRADPSVILRAPLRGRGIHSARDGLLLAMIRAGPMPPCSTRTPVMSRGR